MREILLSLNFIAMEQKERPDVGIFDSWKKRSSVVIEIPKVQNFETVVVALAHFESMMNKKRERKEVVTIRLIGKHKRIHNLLLYNNLTAY